MRFIGRKQYRHDQPESAGILLINLGTPDEPTPKALRKYLRQFLWDPRVVEIPRVLWWMILHMFVLRSRPAKSAEVYKKIWTKEGSPLLVIARRQLEKLSQKLQRTARMPIYIDLGMRYGDPSIESAIFRLYEKGITRLLILPLYPQYSASTTGSSYDAVMQAVLKYRWIPEIRVVNQYCDDEKYIATCASKIKQYWNSHGQGQKLVMSFHGLPRRYLLQGDPYHCQCHKTARLIAASLSLNDDQWLITFQSRFGKAEWLKPYTDETLRSLPAYGITSVDMFCPGFSADCVETLEEIELQNREFFLKAGGKQFHYIPALNDDDDHIDCLFGLVERHTQGWRLFDSQYSENSQEELHQKQKRAMSKGAKK